MQLVDALTTAKAVNKTDVVMLSEAFGVRISSEGRFIFKRTKPFEACCIPNASKQ
jgi:hypothetical protein